MPGYDKVLRLVSAIHTMRENYDHHGPVVAELAAHLAIVAGVSADQLELIQVGAALHDVGKILVRAELVNAPRKLTSSEISEMQTHTTLGWALVDQCEFAPMVCEIVRHHHECYDGNGYPDKLKGDQIPLGARIVCICDSYQALTSKRTYRSAFTPPFAKSFMQTGKERMFDPHLVDLFFEKVIKDA